MADPADDVLKALNASMKVALGKLTGNDALEAEGKREHCGDEHSGNPARKPAAPAKAAPAKAASASSKAASKASKKAPRAPSKKRAVSGAAKARAPRRRS